MWGMYCLEGIKKVGISYFLTESQELSFEWAILEKILFVT